MRSRRARVSAVLAIAVLVAVPVAAHAFVTGQAPVRIGAHTATASPTLDGQATLVVGGLVPSLRVGSGLPLGLGVEVRVVGTEADSLDTMVQRDAVIAAAPEGEVARVRAALVDLAAVSALRGAAVGAVAGLAVTVLWWVVGPQRRRELARAWRLRPGARPARRPGPVRARSLLRPVPVLAVVATVLLVVTAVAVAPRVSVPEEQWTPIGELVPEARLDSELAAIEVADGTATTTGVDLIRGAIATYQESIGYYDALAERVATVSAEFRVPEDGEVVAVLVSDRHDNVGMDRVARAVGDAAGATVLLDAGDDTASGAGWEDFSIDSLAAAFEGYEVVAATGNHDAGGLVADEMEQAGFTVLDGEPVEVAGIWFLGAPDPRVSGFGAGAAAGAVPFDDVAASLVEPACADERVSTVLVHSPTIGLPVAESGCVDLVLSGHLHRQVGPDRVTAFDGRTTTTYTNGTTGGAAYAFALGSALRRPAQLTLVTFDGGRPRGLQPVDIDIDGSIEVQPYHALVLSPRRVE